MDLFSYFASCKSFSGLQVGRTVLKGFGRWQKEFLKSIAQTLIATCGTITRVHKVDLCEASTLMKSMHSQTPKQRELLTSQNADRLTECHTAEWLICTALFFINTVLSYRAFSEAESDIETQSYKRRNSYGQRQTEVANWVNEYWWLLFIKHGFSCCARSLYKVAIKQYQWFLTSRTSWRLTNYRLTLPCSPSK